MGAPFSKSKSPRTVVPSRTNDRIAQQDSSEESEKRPSAPVITDKVAALMSDPTYITDFTWPSLYTEAPGGRMRQLFVSQFFPNKGVAIDKFYSMDEVEPWAVEFKRNALEKLGVKYFALYPTTKWSDIAAGLGA